MRYVLWDASEKRIYRSLEDISGARMVGSDIVAEAKVIGVAVDESTIECRRCGSPLDLTEEEIIAYAEFGIEIFCDGCE